MPDTWVIKLPQVDLPEEPILIHITKKLGHELDLDLLATDGNAAFKGKLRQRNYTKSKASNYDGTDDQWAAILRYVLISRDQSGIKDEDKNALAVDCSISKKSSNLLITFRTRIEDITHRLGAIELASSEDVSGVDLFAWSCQAIDQRDEFANQIASEATEAQSTQQEIASLKKQLDDLIKAKDEHEDQLLSKFTLLLNEKRLKIRNQQRILQTAKIDSKKLAALQLSLSGDQTHSSANKRRRGGTGNPDDESESDGFEIMEVDDEDDKLEDNEDDTDHDGQMTDTASEDEEDLDGPPTKATTGSRTTRKSKAMSPPPPPRTLPFQKKDTKNAKAAKPATPPPVANNEDDEETASEDDEL